MNTLQEAFDEMIAQVPTRFLQKAIAKKLRDQGITEPKSLPAKLAKHIMQGGGEVLTINTNKHSGNVSLSFTEADRNELSNEINSFLETRLPKLVNEIGTRTAKKMLRVLTSRWPLENNAQIADMTDFRSRLEERWGKPLGQLRMLLTMAREWGQSVHEKNALRNSGMDSSLKEILLRLHVRACQVTDEIICLLENGFADGAMARWRTLHEIAVVAAVIFRHGEDIATRYMAHQAIESKRAMEKYMSCCHPLGYRPISAKHIKKILTRYQAAVKKYGKQFDADYGWATHHLKKKRVTFADLETEAGRQDMRSHYQMGNDNVHAGAKSMFIRLGLVDGHRGFLAGRSNFGLLEPGQLAAHTLIQLSMLVCISQPKLDDIVVAEIMRKLGEEIPVLFRGADRRLRRDDKQYTDIALEEFKKLNLAP